MEKRAKEINLPYDLYYFFPRNAGMNASDAKRALEMGLPIERLAVDVHVGPNGGIQAAETDFMAKPWFYNSAVNLETNAGTHDLKRGLQVWIGAPILRVHV